MENGPRGSGTTPQKGRAQARTSGRPQLGAVTCHHHPEPAQPSPPLQDEREARAAMGWN